MAWNPSCVSPVGPCPWRSSSTPRARAATAAWRRCHRCGTAAAGVAGAPGARTAQQKSSGRWQSMAGHWGDPECGEICETGRMSKVDTGLEVWVCCIRLGTASWRLSSNDFKGSNQFQCGTVGTKYQRATCTKNMIISWTCGCPSFKNSKGKTWLCDMGYWYGSNMRIVKVTWNYDMKSMVSGSLSSICSNDLCLYPPVLSDCWWNLDNAAFFKPTYSMFVYCSHPLFSGVSVRS